jgi:hypothetical protein
MLTWLKKYWAELFVAVLLVLWVQAVFSAPLTKEQARDIYAVAYGQVTGPPEWLSQPPIIHVVSPEVLCGMVEQNAACSIRGVYDSGTIYISDAVDFGSVYGASILLHEFVHHLQYLKGGAAHDCSTWLAYEQQAYLIQAHVLQKAGDYLAAQTILFSMRQMRCTD